jgi:RimJ/RimL family protein N-acetyltransferase
MSTLTLHTDRLVLRPFAGTDLGYIEDVMRRPEVVRYLYWDAMSHAESVALLERRVQAASLSQPGDQLVLAVELRETSEVIGDVMLGWAGSRHHQGEVGYIFHPDFQGKGYASEAVRAMLRLGFDTVGLHRVIGRCDVRNTGSYRLMERIGMRREAHLVENEWFKGEWGSEFIYALLEHEWASLSAEGTRDP